MVVSYEMKYAIYVRAHVFFEWPGNHVLLDCVFFVPSACRLYTVNKKDLKLLHNFLFFENVFVIVYCGKIFEFCYSFLTRSLFSGGFTFNLYS